MSSSNSENISAGQFYSIKDHIKIHVAQSAKGARVEVTIDREDHDIETAVNQAVDAYKKSIAKLKDESMKVDEA